jgi:hypothetical protein
MAGQISDAVKKCINILKNTTSDTEKFAALFMVTKLVKGEERIEVMLVADAPGSFQPDRERSAKRGGSGYTGFCRLGSDQVPANVKSDNRQSTAEIWRTLIPNICDR